MTGDVLAAGAAGVLTNVTVRAVGDNGSEAQAATSSEQKGWVPLAIAAGVLVVVVAAIAALLARRRHAKTGS